MSRIIIPGTYDPPTYGHCAIANRAAEIFGPVSIVCSHNETKTDTRWFDPKTAVKLWESYDLDPNIAVRTFDAQLALPGTKKADYVILRGIRDEKDFAHEASVIEKNFGLFGIDCYSYIKAGPKYVDVSSSMVHVAARELDFETLARTVSPGVITELLKYVLKAEHVKLVVGPPGSGKTTFLEFLNKCDSRNIIVHTDNFNNSLSDILRKHFASEDIISILVSHDREASELLKVPWLKKVKESLSKIPPGSRIFIEAAFGLGEHKSVYKYLGGDVLYVGCNVRRDNERRLRARGTPHLIPLLKLIPNFEESVEITKANRLSITPIYTDGTLQNLADLAEVYATSLNEMVHWRSVRQ